MTFTLTGDRYWGRISRFRSSREGKERIMAAVAPLRSLFPLHAMSRPHLLPPSPTLPHSQRERRQARDGKGRAELGGALARGRRRRGAHLCTLGTQHHPGPTASIPTGHGAALLIVAPKNVQRPLIVRGSVKLQHQEQGRLAGAAGGSPAPADYSSSARMSPPPLPPTTP